MILLSVIFGVLIGNYATTLLFRMPMGIEICGINKQDLHYSELNNKFLVLLSVIIGILIVICEILNLLK